jgi:hypothetical protein
VRIGSVYAAHTRSLEVFFSNSVPSPAQDILDRGHRLDRPPVTRRHDSVDRTHRTPVPQPTRSRLLFAHWDTTTPSPQSPTPRTGLPTPDRALAMPLRKRTRSAEHTARIRRERQRNQDTIDNNPPPF